MKEKPKISETLSSFFAENNLEHYWEAADHPGCWGKECEGEHLVWELNVHREGKPQIGWSFEGCSDFRIMEKLTDRLSKTAKKTKNS